MKHENSRMTNVFGSTGDYRVATIKKEKGVAATTAPA
jgi:hypothetical protein